MEALEFLKERKRLCNSYKNCDGCPFVKGLCAISDITSDEERKSVIATVEQWAKEHPRKTRQSVFLEQYPQSQMNDSYGLHELAEADKDGRLVVLPFSDADDVEMQRDGITYKSDHWNILLTAFADNYLTLSGRKLGVFSVNEAEKALEAMKNE